jgi:ribosomal protein L28
MKYLKSLPPLAIALCLMGPAATAGHSNYTYKPNVQKSYGFSGARYGGYVTPRTNCNTWVPGRWTYQSQKVWIRGTSRRVWFPARFETRFDSYGRPYQVQVCASYYQSVPQPGHFEYRQKKVWQAPHWSRR